MFEDTWKRFNDYDNWIFYHCSVCSMEVGRNYYMDCETCSYFSELSEGEK